MFDVWWVFEGFNLVGVELLGCEEYTFLVLRGMLNVFVLLVCFDSSVKSLREFYVFVNIW